MGAETIQHSKKKGEIYCLGNQTKVSQRYVYTYIERAAAGWNSPLGFWPAALRRPASTSLVFLLSRPVAE